MRFVWAHCLSLSKTLSMTSHPSGMSTTPHILVSPTNTCKGRHYFQSNLLTIFKASQKYPSFIKFRKMFIVSQKVFLTACKSAFVFLRVDQHSCLSRYPHLSHYHTSSKKQSLASTKQSLSFIFILISFPAFSYLKAHKLFSNSFCFSFWTLLNGNDPACFTNQAYTLEAFTTAALAGHSVICSVCNLYKWEAELS